MRLANILYSYLLVIKQAIDRFGKENVSMFFEGGLSSIKEKLAKLNSSKDFVTISALKGDK